MDSKAQYSRYRDRILASQRARRKANPAKYSALYLASMRRRRYGISPEDFQGMLEAQAGLCAICCEPMRPGRWTHVDHNHETGRVRGLLCHSCNLGIGHLKEDPLRFDAASSYVEGWC